LDDKIKRLEELFNKLFKIMEISYSEFNTVFKFEGDKLEAIKKLEKEYPELGLYSNIKNGNNFIIEGVSVVSLMATITDIFCGKRFGVDIIKNDRDIENSLINGCGFVDYNDNLGEKN